MPNRSLYTEEVMAKVRALSPAAVRASEHSPSRFWLPWPRLALVALTAAAGIALVFGSIRSSTNQLAEQTTHEAQLLAAVGAFDEEAADEMLLAESPSSDEQWLDETVQLLEQVDESDSDSPESSSSNDWLDELELLDETELSASS